MLEDMDYLYKKYIIDKRIPYPSSIANRSRKWSITLSIKNDIKMLRILYKENETDDRLIILKEEILKLYIDTNLNENHHERLDNYNFLK